MTSNLAQSPCVFVSGRWLAWLSLFGRWVGAVCGGPRGERSWRTRKKKRKGVSEKDMLSIWAVWWEGVGTGSSRREELKIKEKEKRCEGVYKRFPCQVNSTCEISGSRLWFWCLLPASVPLALRRAPPTAPTLPAYVCPERDGPWVTNTRTLLLT